MSSGCEWLRYNVSDYNGNEEIYNPFRALYDIFSAFGTYFKCYQHTDSSSFSMRSDFANYFHFRLEDVAAAIVLTFLWAIAHNVLALKVFPAFCRAWKMEKTVGEKFSESAFKTFAYSFMWITACYVTFFREHDFFFNTLSMWSDCYNPNQPVDLRLVYGLETSFYLFSCYTCLFIDKWKKDTPVMLIHHIVTLNLVIFSYGIGYLKIGIIIFLLDDITDILLDGAKCFTYLKVKGAKYAELWNNLSLAMSSMFVIVWFFFRNIFHLTKVWRSSSYGSMHSAPRVPTPFWLFFNILVGSLYLFYMYWFYFIVLFIIRIWKNEFKDPDDPRDSADFEKDTKTGKLSDDDDDNNPELDFVSPDRKGRKAD